MPLSNLQTEILRTLASQRNPESYVAGSTPLNRHAARFSGDIDVFHDSEDSLAASALADTQTLIQAGYNVSWLRQLPMIHTAYIRRDDAQTRLEWVVDSDFRFFPTMPDELFGYILHPVDLAINKVMAAAGRSALRDFIDLITIHENILPLGAVVWAAVEKSPGFTPEGLIAEIRRNSNFPSMEWKALETSVPIDPRVTTQRIRAILEEAEAFVARMPSAKAGLLFLKDGNVVLPDPDHLRQYQTHAGQRRGQWPGSAEISRSMLERYEEGRSAQSS